MSRDGTTASGRFGDTVDQGAHVVHDSGELGEQLASIGAYVLFRLAGRTGGSRGKLDGT